jgi:hypothetical protein
MRRIVCGGVLGCLLLLLACGGSEEEDSEGGTVRSPCGAPAGEWTYLLSCDYTFAGLVHQCSDFYATKSAASAAKQSFTAFCSALSGKVLSGVCPAAGSIGSCVNTSTTSPSGMSQAGALSQLYSYSSSTSAASYRADCENDGGVYVAPDGTAPALPAGANASECKSGGGGGDGANLFSVSVYLNDQVIECTNYVGPVTQAQLDSVIATGAEEAPCPRANVICSCDVPNSLFGTDATLIYYRSPTSSGEDCPNQDPSCVDGYRGP